MTFFEFLWLCVVQTITELLPISSSGHLVLVNSLLTSNPLPIRIIILLHLYTAVVISILLLREITSILFSYTNTTLTNPPKITSKFKYIVSYRRFKLLKLIALSCFFTVFPFFFVRESIGDLFSTVQFVGWALLANGIILMISTKLKSGDKSIYDISWLAACLIGFAQFVGIVPGISRLGITLLVALLCGMQWRNAVIYSYLISVPVIIGGAINEMIPLINNTSEFSSSLSILHHLVGFIIIAVIGITAIRLLLSKIGQKSLIPFAIWCWIAGATAILLTSSASQ